MNEVSNEEKINNIKETRSAVLGIISYVVAIFLFASVLLAVLIAFYSNTHKELNYKTLLDCCTAQKLDDFAEEYINARNLLMSMANFIAYAICTIILFLLFKKVLLDDLVKLTKRPKFYAIFIPAAILIFYALSLIIDYLVLKVSPQSDNQSSIEAMIKSEGKYYIILMVCLLAPLTEELIYRYAIFKLTKKTHLAVSYVISVIAFALPHVLSTDINTVGVGIWFLQMIPYAASGLMFAMMYHLSGYNIYVSLTAHMLNNIVSVIKVLN